jgi:hypothetical protein
MYKQINITSLYRELFLSIYQLPNLSNPQTTADKVRYKVLANTFKQRQQVIC